MKAGENFLLIICTRDGNINSLITCCNLFKYLFSTVGNYNRKNKERKRKLIGYNLQGPIL